MYLSVLLSSLHMLLLLLSAEAVDMAATQPPAEQHFIDLFELYAELLSVKKSATRARA